MSNFACLGNFPCGIWPRSIRKHSSCHMQAWVLYITTCMNPTWYRSTDQFSDTTFRVTCFGQLPPVGFSLTSLDNPNPAACRLEFCTELCTSTRHRSSDKFYGRTFWVTSFPLIGHLKFQGLIIPQIQCVQTWVLYRFVRINPILYWSPHQLSSTIFPGHQLSLNMVVLKSMDW